MHWIIVVAFNYYYPVCEVFRFVVEWGWMGSGMSSWQTEKIKSFQ